MPRYTQGDGVDLLWPAGPRTRMHNCKKIINGDGESGRCEERALIGASRRCEEGDLADASGWYGEWRSGLRIPERRQTDTVVPVTLAGKGTPSNIQNERGGKIRSSKSEIRRAASTAEGAGLRSSARACACAGPPALRRHFHRRRSGAPPPWR